MQFHLAVCQRQISEKSYLTIHIERQLGQGPTLFSNHFSHDFKDFDPLETVLSV
jgi:hypothetical protein